MTLSATGRFFYLPVLLWFTVAGCNSSSKTTAVDRDSKGEVAAPAAAKNQEPLELLNVSYDPTRELWKELNKSFEVAYQEKYGQPIKVSTTHGGSASQARAVIDGLAADVLTLSMPNDTAAVAKAGKIKEGWEDRFPNGSLPYTSTIVFVVRKGNPHHIKDWPDLIQPNLKVITPSPKTSGNGKLSFLAAWGSVTKRGGDEAQAKEFVTKLYQNVPVLDSGARGATTTFTQKGIGDVHLTWENEAYFELKGTDEYELIIPPISIRAEPRVAVIDETVDAKGTRAAAEEYLNFVYTDAGQEIVAKHHYRPFRPEILAKHAKDFPTIEQFNIQDVARNWADADEKFFADGKVFDQIYAPNN